MHAIRTPIAAIRRQGRAHIKLLAVIATGAVSAAAAQPALADTFRAYEGFDKAWTSATHQTVWVQDYERDNALVYANVRTSNGAIYRVSAWMAETGWGSNSSHFDPLTIVGLQVCEQDNFGYRTTRCGAWVNH